MRREIWIFVVIILALLVGFFILTANQNSKSKSSSYSLSDIKINQNPTETITNSNTDTQMNKKNAPKISKPTMTIDKSKIYTAVLHTTQGDITVELNAADTPITVNNFVYLAKNNFYDNTIFHRVIKGFMIQGGDPKGNGTGGPGYQFNDEPFKGEYTRGTIAMANAGPNTNGSQFFIMHADYPLPKNYVIFGKVIDGMDVVDTIANSEVKTSSSGEQSSPVSPTTVSHIEIQEK